MSYLEYGLLNFAHWLNIILRLVFLLPVRDDRGRHRSFPYMTVGLVVVNTAVFALVELLLGLGIGDPEVWYLPLRFTPADVVSGGGLGAVSVITAVFLHANLDHLFGNMLLLFFFGRKLEDVLGPVKFALFYMVCAFASCLGFMVQELFQLHLTQGMIPGLGASGAVMGVMGAYLFLYPGQRIQTWPTAFWQSLEDILPISIPIFMPIPIPITISLPAWVFIVHAILKDLLSGWLDTRLQDFGLRYAFVGGAFAHLGGVIAGLVCTYFFLPSEILHYRHRVGEKAD